MYFFKKKMEFEEANNVVKKDGNDDTAARRLISNKIMIERFNELTEDFSSDTHKMKAYGDIF